MSLEPDFETSPAKCLTGLKFTVLITLDINFIRIRRTALLKWKENLYNCKIAKKRCNYLVYKHSVKIVLFSVLKHKTNRTFI